ncbi:hypothetical protein JZK55_17480 [Dissulfurispira thermophila]|uniref:Bacteriophage lambda Replication protein O N-terminal domain-containing protein n=1 Tax=Dissulfurispira thermophila TaxID=2715679 RepID=A0A7G1H4J1_9BACT|nr:replication protein [Dissulfurispira thermophila]BCB96826.1 hypothetical protein JZK55_17480 [Dissulfurispira thermophila]
MASPQVENGYTRIANELLDAMLATEFTGREFRILLAIIRYSYGWHKKEARLTVKDFHQVTGLSSEHGSTIYKTIRRLILANVIHQVADYTYQLNKDYTTWQIDQRRYNPLKKQTSDCVKADHILCKSEPQIVEKRATDCVKANHILCKSEPHFVEKRTTFCGKAGNKFRSKRA